MRSNSHEKTSYQYWKFQVWAFFWDFEFRAHNLWQIMKNENLAYINWRKASILKDLFKQRPWKTPKLIKIYCKWLILKDFADISFRKWFEMNNSRQKLLQFQNKLSVLWKFLYFRDCTQQKRFSQICIDGNVKFRYPAKKKFGNEGFHMS